MQQSVTDYFIRKKNIRQSDIITVVYLFPCRATAKRGIPGKNPVIAVLRCSGFNKIAPVVQTICNITQACPFS